jgi:hypothetical protein
MSRSNVVSLERDLAGPDSASTTSEPWKCARACRSRPWRVPKRCARTSGSACCSEPIVLSPIAASRSAVLGPIPGMIRSDAPARRRHASSRPMATNPCGFSRSEAILAMSRFGPTPTDTPIPVRSRTSATSSRSARSGLSASVTSA